MKIIKMKDSGMIVDFGDLGESETELTEAGRFNATHHEFVTATPTFPSDPTAFRAGAWQDQECYMWGSSANSFEVPAVVVPQLYTHGQCTRTEMLALSPSIGDSVYCTTYNQMFWWTGNTWQCAQTVEGLNNSGATVYEGDCLVPSGALAFGYSTTTTMYHPSIVGTTAIGGVQGAYITIAVAGIWEQYVYGTLTVGEHIVSYNSNGNGYGVGGPPASVSGQFATSKEVKSTTPVAKVKVQLDIMAHY